MYEIILDNAETISNLRLMSDLHTYISDVPIHESTFTGNLSRVTINNIDDNTSYVETNLKFVDCGSDSEKVEYYFQLIPIPKEDLRYAQTRSDIEYLAMMADVDLGLEESLY